MQRQRLEQQQLQQFQLHCPCSFLLIFVANNEKQESRAVARKPRDVAAVLFGLKFADYIHYKPNFKSQASQLQTYRRKTEFNEK